VLLHPTAMTSIATTAVAIELRHAPRCAGLDR
jgi:hypothetical protein